MDFKETYETLTDDQKKAIDYLIMGKNTFLTGEAGTGKSYVVNAYTKYCDENDISIIKCAPTGIAAVNIEGATLHHQFKLDLGPLTSLPYTYPECLDNVDVVLIDEISMCRIDVFENVMFQISLANKNPKRMASGKFIQIVLVGDFFQLPPVITDLDRYQLEQYFNGKIGKGFAFQSKTWKQFGFRLINLTTIIRQADKVFCENLSKARHGDYSCVRFIEDHSSKKTQDLKNSICLTGVNKTANDINLAGLKMLDTKEYTSSAIIVGEVQKGDYPCDDEFVFKTKARVMALINDKDGQYYNGSIGTITNYNEETKRITVLFDNGEEAVIGRHTFECYRYEDAKKANKDYINQLNDKLAKLQFQLMGATSNSEAKKISDEIETCNKTLDNLNSGKASLVKTVIGTVTQFPLKLAYAITIHKSQGQTFERVNLVPQIFDDGQFYVAISRCKSIENIYIHGTIDPTKIKANQEVEEFYANPDEYSYFDKKWVTIKISKEQYNELYGKLLTNARCYEAAKKAIEGLAKLNARDAKIEELKIKLKAKR